MLEIFIALGAGLISFLSPCVLPLIPGYVSFISGFTLDELVKTKKINIISLILFCFGFSLVFIILGASASAIGKFFLYNTNYFRIIAGLIIIIFSLQLLGIINIKYFNFEKKFYTKKPSNRVFIIVIGMAFGFGWTPCIGPILGSIIALASTQENILLGVILLSFYSLGLAIPFILSGILMQKFIVFSKNIKQKINLITKLGGSLLLITGILIITNQLQVLGFYLFDYIPILQKFG